MKMELNIIDYLIDIISQLASPHFMKFYEISVASDWTYLYVHT